MYEMFEHTADLGLRVRADDLPGLIAEAGRGLTAMLVDNPDSVRAIDEIVIRVEGDQPEYLLFDWLNELLYRYDSQQWLGREFEVQLDSTGLEGIARGEPVDRGRHQLAREVKAITYHQLIVEQQGDEWQAELIVDI